MAAVKGILGGEACAAVPCAGAAAVHSPAAAPAPTQEAPIVPGFLELPIFAPTDAPAAPDGLFGFLSKLFAG